LERGTYNINRNGWRATCLSNGTLTQSDALVTCWQSTNPDSPDYADQTKLFSAYTLTISTSHLARSGSDRGEIDLHEVNPVTLIPIHQRR